ncbi:MAG TPA: peptide ABC transporter permease [Gammaproteobacteria bacterium]|jgi:peptide/nickel transport system permease protein|nr:peptide ABC transporter permease [Acidiferrobacteraceae bacterium]HAG46140.1 peptide ABC transporter permease [Gammaproteobacteria bacterium]HAU11531.1 peptide ABC transporter permease [Gammaproteobacteria bacterium]|tara:strand:- start:8681 stop:9559 length:879 start_codon:yes stop_codon:yes gene_type:complete
MDAIADESLIVRGSLGARVWQYCRRNPTIVIGALLLLMMLIIALLASHLTPDPMKLNPIKRLRVPGEGMLFGTDMYGRDVFARTLHGSRISLLVGLSAAAVSTLFGLTIGLMAGYNRLFDTIVMRFMDGIMAIPSILLAIALVSLTGASVGIVIVAISIPEIPRVVRLVRSVVLTIREQPYVEAAISVGARLPKILLRHILPNTLAPLIVQATYVCASAMITEAILSFLGAGTPPDIPSWGNVISEGRQYFQRAPWIIFFPGVFLTITVLAVNILGDGLRDGLDPRIARQMR